MNPLVFGSSDKALFGIYHPPSGQPPRNRGVVICNPFGDEAIKAHRALRELANRLAAARFHVMRFDYFATGDSAGTGDEASMPQWVDDIGTAADELKDASGVAKVSFVGLRLGGTLALRAAARRRDIDRLALWDPVVSGRPYFEFLRQAHLSYLRGEHGADLPRFERLAGTELMGYPVPTELRAAIEAIDLGASAPLEVGKIKKAVVVTSSKTDDTKSFVAALGQGGLEVDHQYVPVGVNWNSDAAMESSLVPTEAINAIVAGLS